MARGILCVGERVIERVIEWSLTLSTVLSMIKW